MAREQKQYSNTFLEYQEYIVRNENYKGIPFNRKYDGSIVWLAPKQTEIGRGRIEWARERASELGINTNENGWMAKVMYEVHPTKTKPCQICGRILNLNYVYASKNFIKYILKEFDCIDEGYEINEITDIVQIIDILIESEYEMDYIKEFLIETFRLTQLSEYSSIGEIVEGCINACKYGTFSYLSPGAMSNYPDRLCGFHSYNRCCRSKEDKGRSKENMGSYSKDRRAYEYWSDGNIPLANKYMKSKYFKGETADHIGPISLGFKHESVFIEKATSRDNLSKGDRISEVDIEKLINLEQKYNNSSISWYGEIIWEFIKENYQNLKIEDIRKVLKQNVHNYMEILYIIKNKTGIDFLYNVLIKHKEEYFDYDYKFDENGYPINIHRKARTDLYYKEIARLCRVSLESIDEYNSKENRNLKCDLNDEQVEMLKALVVMIRTGNYQKSLERLKELISNIQYRLIECYLK
ncbi:MAG: hypothetical protein ACRCXT_16820 [Paraclostridium sp.]